MSGAHHDPHDSHGKDAATPETGAPKAYEPPQDVDPIVLFIPPVIGFTIAITVVMAIIWF